MPEMAAMTLFSAALNERNQQKQRSSMNKIRARDLMLNEQRKTNEEGLRKLNVESEKNRTSTLESQATAFQNVGLRRRGIAPIGTDLSAAVLDEGRFG